MYILDKVAHEGNNVEDVLFNQLVEKEAEARRESLSSTVRQSAAAMKLVMQDDAAARNASSGA